jgi:alkylation response protein AidB-like acyl-CoA dehydrogenase
MDLTYPPEAEVFRREARTWIEAHLPDGWMEGRRPTGADAAAFAERWSDELHASGFAVPGWPVEYGGRALSPLEEAVFAEEIARVGAPIQPPAGGEILVGPTILHWGTEDQKRRFLPGTARGEITWCQGFSEPGAGSDLGSLTTSAVRDGDDWVIHGHKIWTSEAQDANYVFLLARTDPDAPKHKGISYFLVPMDQPGIEVRQIVQIDGTGGFAEVLFDGARCPDANLVGGVNNGWTVAMSTLDFERGTSSTSSYRRFAMDLDDIVAAARANGRIRDATIRQRLAAAWSFVQIMRINEYRVLTAVVHPRTRPAVAGLMAGTKATWTEFQQVLMDLAIDVEGTLGQVLTGVTGGPPVPGVGLGYREPHHDYPATPSQLKFLFSRSGTIFGGTSEVQRNIIGERVLGLPREPRPNGS